MPGSNYTYITTAATNVISGSAIKRVNLKGIFINKALVGIVTIKTGSTTIGIFAAATTPGTYWNVTGGTEVADLQIINASGEDITVAWDNL